MLKTYIQAQDISDDIFYMTKIINFGDTNLIFII